MPVIEWRQTARADLLTIVDYISDDNPDAAQQLKDDIEAKVAKLAEHPKLYRPGRAHRLAIFVTGPVSVASRRLLPSISAAERGWRRRWRGN